MFKDIVWFQLSSHFIVTPSVCFKVLQGKYLVDVLLILNKSAGLNQRRYIVHLCNFGCFTLPIFAKLQSFVSLY